MHAVKTACELMHAVYAVQIRNLKSHTYFPQIFYLLFGQVTF